VILIVFDDFLKRYVIILGQILGDYKNNCMLKYRPTLMLQSGLQKTMFMLHKHSEECGNNFCKNFGCNT
jgi:hypothetical protein